MQDIRKLAIKSAAEEIRQTLGSKLNRRVTDLNRTALKSKKDLPKKIRRSIKIISDAETNLHHKPYVSPQLADQVQKSKNKVTEFANEIDTKASKKATRKQWVTSLFLNYSGFLMLLFIFWYVATQM